MVSGDCKPSQVAPAQTFKTQPVVKQTVNTTPQKATPINETQETQEKPTTPSTTVAEKELVVKDNNEEIVKQQIEQPVKPTIVASAGNEDVTTAWQGILQNIESVPSRMFFYNLSRPISISKEGIEIGFLKDIFVKQAKEDTKNAPLKKAAMNYFGVSDINIHIRQLDTNEQIQEQAKPALEKLEKKPAEPKPSSTAEIEEENAQLLKEAFAPTSSPTTPSKIDKNDIPADLSDQSKMVMELFNGKLVE